MPMWPHSHFQTRQAAEPSVEHATYVKLKTTKSFRIDVPTANLAARRPGDRVRRHGMSL
jgi:hypothetical protein